MGKEYTCPWIPRFRMDPTIQDRARRNQQIQQVGQTQRAFTGVGNLPSRRLILTTGYFAPAVTILRSEQTSECGTGHVDRG